MSEIAGDDLKQRAWLAYVRQELTTSAVALGEAASAFESKAGADGGDVSTLAARIRDRAEVYRSKVAQFLSGPFERATAEERRGLRHDLRGAVGYIVSAAEDVRESAEPAGLDRFGTELTEVLAVARKVLVGLQNLSKDAAADASPIRDTLAGLPAAIARAAATADTAAPGLVLIVDDNEFSRDLMTKQLRQQGQRVEAVAGGREAQLRLTDAERPAVDVIVTDVLMPEITGIDLLKWLKADAHFWPIPVIMVSALGDDDSVLACIGAGAEDYLVRPVRPDLLRARIAGSLEKKRLRDRELEYQARIDRLVRAMFPPAVVDEWRRSETIRPKRHEKVGVLFTDIVGFTPWCEKYRDSPEIVVDTLQALIRQFEETCLRHGVQKIKTIGDAFMAVAGLSGDDLNPALTLLRCARELIADAQGHPSGWALRVGLHVGPVVTGVLGQTQFSFDVWGQTVNAAARMESNGRPNRVTLSGDAWADVCGFAEGTQREAIVKGLGTVPVWDFERLCDGG